MKMKTKCSFYLPVEFPLTASLTRERRIDRWPAAETVSGCSAANAKGKLSYCDLYQVIFITPDQ